MASSCCTPERGRPRGSKLYLNLEKNAKANADSYNNVNNYHLDGTFHQRPFEDKLIILKMILSKYLYSLIFIFKFSMDTNIGASLRDWTTIIPKWVEEWIANEANGRSRIDEWRAARSCANSRLVAGPVARNAARDLEIIVITIVR